MHITHLGLEDKLPLTCSRAGTCCHGKMVFLNPWELACLAQAKKISAREFRDQYSEYGGIRLRFNGKPGWKGLLACSQYAEGLGCSVHSGRPLSCRLYPLGRQIQNEKAHYIYQGKEFPCIEGCPEVTRLPHMSVSTYLKGQLVSDFEKAQDEYLEVMQNLADIAFMLLLDTGLAASEDFKTLQGWKELGNLTPVELTNSIGSDWLDILMLPEINDTEDPIIFAQKHNEILQVKAHQEFGNLQNFDEVHKASIFIMGVALHFSRAIGADPKSLLEHWIEIAKNNGAKD